MLSFINKIILENYYAVFIQTQNKDNMSVISIISRINCLVVEKYIRFVVNLFHNSMFIFNSAILHKL